MAWHEINPHKDFACFRQQDEGLALITYALCLILDYASILYRDLQSYLSHRFIYLAPESKKFYILVDNRPWLQDLISHPAHLWQLMVTKVAKHIFCVSFKVLQLI